MKKFTQRVQQLGQKAAQIQQAIQSVPGKAIEIREAVTATAGQIQQLRADVQSAVHGLRTDGNDALTQALREVDAGHDLLARAGYAVHEVEMELGLIQRLVVHLEKVEDVPHGTIRSLLNAQDNRKTLHAILAALLKAEELADTVQLSHLTYHKLTVYAGNTPSVRLCWGAEWEEQEVEAQAISPAAASAPVAFAPASTPPPPPFPAASAFSQSTYFERAAPAASVPALTSTPAPPPAPAAPAAAPAPAPAPATGGDFGRSALDRFKKMPDLSKYRR